LDPRIEIRMVPNIQYSLFLETINELNTIN